MSTYMAKAGQVDRKWYVIDAAGKPLGRVAAQAAVLLRGKHKPTFTPHVDCGDHVIIINCAWHSQFPPYFADAENDPLLFLYT